MNEIILAILGVISIVLTGIIVPVVKQKYGAEKSAELAKWVEIFVKAAEQAINGTRKGQQRKQWVYSQLSAAGIDVKKFENEINALIEKSVYELKTGV